MSNLQKWHSVTAVVLVCCGISTVQLPHAIAAEPQAVETLADQYELEYPALPDPFPTVAGEHYRFLSPKVALPQGTRVTLVNGNYSSNQQIRQSNTVLYVNDDATGRLWLQSFPNSGVVGETILKPKLIVEYSDGSVDAVQPEIKVSPAGRFQYQPILERSSFSPGEHTQVVVSGIGDNAQLEMLDVSKGWNAEVLADSQLGIKAPVTGQSGKMTLRVRYPDTSTDVVTYDLKLSAVPITSTPVTATPTTTSRPYMSTVTTTVRSTVTTTATTTQLTTVTEPTTVTKTSTVEVPITVPTTVEVPTAVPTTVTVTAPLVTETVTVEVQKPAERNEHLVTTSSIGAGFFERLAASAPIVGILSILFPQLKNLLKR